MSALADEIRAAVREALREELPRLLRDAAPANAPPQPDDLLTAEDVAPLLRLSVRTVRARAGAGTLPGLKLAGSSEWRFRRSELDAYTRGNVRPLAPRGLDIQEQARQIAGRLKG